MSFIIPNDVTGGGGERNAKTKHRHLQHKWLSAGF